MGKVVIMDCDQLQLNMFEQMLDQYIQVYDVIYVSEPEEAIQLLKSKEVIIFICELDMPVLTGKELFSICSMVSPKTIKIAMSKIEDVSDVLQFVNECDVFKLLLKPVHFSEDLVSMIEHALLYYEIQQVDEKMEETNATHIESSVAEYEKIVFEIRKKEQMYRQLREVVLQIVEDDFKLELKETRILVDYIDRVMNDFISCFCCSVMTPIELEKRMSERYTIVSEKKIARIELKIGQIPERDFSKLSFACFVFARLYVILLEEYEFSIMIEEVKNHYVVKFICKEWKNKEIDEKTTKLLFSFVGEVLSMFYSKAVIGYEDNPYIAVLSMNRGVEE